MIPLARAAEGFGIVALVAFAMTEQRAYEDRTGPLWVHGAAVVVISAALLLRRRAPLAAVLAGAAAGGAQAAVGFVGSAGELVLVLGLVAVAGSLPERPRRAGLLALGAAFVAIVLRDPDIGTFEAALPSLVMFGGAAALGVALGRHTSDAERLLREEEERAARAVLDERSRIARELHDVVTHSLSVVVVQAGAARLDAPPSQAEVFAVVERTARTALVEMRRLLGVLRSDPGDDLLPQPGMEQLPLLVDQVRAAGLKVDLVVEGDPQQLAPGPDLAAYRVLQESLTNVLKHAGAGSVVVKVAWKPHRLLLAILDDGDSGRATAPGQGLLGMSERAQLYGGSLVAGPRGGGGWAVEAVLPFSPLDLLAER